MSDTCTCKRTIMIVDSSSWLQKSCYAVSTVFYVAAYWPQFKRAQCLNISCILVPKMSDFDCPADENCAFDCLEKIADFSSSLQVGYLRAKGYYFLKDFFKVVCEQ